MKKEKMFLIIALVMVVAMAVPAVSALTLTIGSVTMNAAGDTASMDLYLDSAPDGLSGYEFNVTVADPAVAEITGVTAPAWSLTVAKKISNGDAYLKAVDFGAFDPSTAKVPAGSSNIYLGTVTVTATALGTTKATLAQIKIDDIAGMAVIPTIVDGVIQVGPVCADADQDGVCDAADNCPAVANPNQEDADKDGAGDACDGCAADPLKTAPGQCGCGVVDTPGCGCSDVDQDGVCDTADNCPAVANPNQADADGDGAGDACDGCAADAGKTAPGQCGCGVADTDSDGDGTADCNDLCPTDPLKTAPGQCGCNVVDTPFCGGCSDVDSDGVCDAADNCPAVANPNQEDADGDGAGDACDRCPSDPAKIVPGQCGCGVPEGTCPGIPEFPSMVIPAISLIGVLSLVFLAQNRKEN